MYVCCVLACIHVVFFCLPLCVFFGYYSLTNWPKVVKFSGFDGGHPGDVIAKFSEDQFVP